MTNEEKMKLAIESVGDALTIVGDCLLVERLPKKEVKFGSIIAAPSASKQITGFDSNPPEFVKVLAVGRGYYDDDKNKDVPLDLKPGNIIELGRNSVVWFSSFGTVLDNQKDGTGIGLARESDHRLRFENMEAYNKFMEAFER